jgi:hypothetical protein
MSYIRFLSCLYNQNASTPQIASHILHCNNCGFGQPPVSWCIPTECVTRLLRYAGLSLLLQHVFAVMSLALPLFGTESLHLLGQTVTVKFFGDVVKETVCRRAVCFCSGFCSLTSKCCKPLTLACCNHIKFTRVYYLVCLPLLFYDNMLVLLMGEMWC